MNDIEKSRAVIEEFIEEMDIYTPSDQRETLVQIKALLPYLEEECERRIMQTMDVEKVIEGIRGPAYSRHLRLRLRRLVRMLRYHKPKYQKEIVAILENRLPELRLLNASSQLTREKQMALLEVAYAFIEQQKKEDS